MPQSTQPHEESSREHAVSVAALPAPSVSLPTSPHTVRVRVIDTESKMLCHAHTVVEPVLRGHEKVRFSTVCFLIEHPSSSSVSATEYVLFDCGMRTDFWNLPPELQRRMRAVVPGIQVDRGVDKILTDQGFDLANLKAMVWSHWHWDHIGDGAKFPPSTDIVVGPGFTDNFVPGWPTNPNGHVCESSMQGHRIHEPDFPLEVAGFPAHDYFGDGSFYLLDVPGTLTNGSMFLDHAQAQKHTVGHICGLARTTPDTFIFMGADCTHFAGVIRPTAYVPLPATIPAVACCPFDADPDPDAARLLPQPSSCPCSAFATMHHRHRDRDAQDDDDDDDEWRRTPFYNLSRSSTSIYQAVDIAQASADRVKVLDAQDNVLICLAHDGALIGGALPLFNDDAAATVNDWRARGYKDKTRWGFLGEFPRTDGTLAYEQWPEGLWCGGKQVDWDSGSVLLA